MSTPQLPAGRRTIPFDHDGRQRPYLLYLPTEGKTEAGWPLVLELHGRGIDAVRFDAMTGFISLAEEKGFVLVAPSAMDEIWNDGRDPVAALRGAPDDVGYLTAILDDVSERLPIYSRRVYVVGMSNGAAMAGRLVCERPERFGAVAQVAGTAAADVAATCRRDKPLPIIQIHGTADPYWPYEGGVARGLRKRVLLGRHYRPVVGVDEWAHMWISANGAAPEPALEHVSADTSARKWHGPASSSDVVFYRVEGGGHTWPNAHLVLPSFIFGRATHTFSATKAIWAFFDAHGLASVSSAQGSVDDPELPAPR